MTWIPVTDPPLMYQEEVEWFTSIPVLVYTKGKTGASKILVATLEKWDEYPPTWYSNCSEHWNLNNTVKFWMPLPNPPRINHED